MRIGFDVSDEVQEEGIEVGDAEVLPNFPSWVSEIPEFAYESILKFWLIYGMYSSIRDLVSSIF